MRARYVWALTIMLGLASAPAWSQFPQYIAPGSLVIPQVTASQRAQQGYDEARWKLGDIRLGPLFRVAGPSYINNVFSAPKDEPQVSDIKATIGLGLASYVHFGPKVIGSIYAMPEYVWWNDLAQLRETTGELGAGLFGYFNRLTLELLGRSSLRQTSLNNELDVPVSIREDRGELNFEVDIHGPLSTFGSGSASQLRYSEPGDSTSESLDVTGLDRDEEVFDLGLRYTLRSGLAVGLGFEYSKSEFLEDLGGRSNSGTSPLLTIGWNAPHFEIDIAVVWRQLEFFNDPTRDDFTDTTGAGWFRWIVSERLSFALYGARTLIYSALDEQGLTLEERIGLAVESAIVRRLSLRFWVESGSADFAATDSSGFSRLDEFLSYGGGADFELSLRFSLQVRAGTTDWDSNVPSFNRSVSRLETNFGIRGGSLPW